MNSMIRAGAMLLLTLSAWGCDGPTTPPPAIEPGVLEFRYTGGLPELFHDGAYEARGAPALDAEGRASAGEWTVAGMHPFSSQLVPAGSKRVVVGFVPGSAGRGTLVAITLPRVDGPTTVRIEGTCSSVDCARVLVLLGVDPRRPHDAVQGSCELGAGEVRITAAGNGRVEGSFAGSGRCVRDPRRDPYHDITVEGGRFSAEVVDDYRSRLQIWS